MKFSTLIFFLLFLFSSSSLHAQEAKPEVFTISGYLKDAKNGEVLIGANVYVQGNNALGATSNLYGFYSLSLPKGTYQMAYSYLGFNTQIM